MDRREELVRFYNILAELESGSVVRGSLSIAAAECNGQSEECTFSSTLKKVVWVPEQQVQGSFEWVRMPSKKAERRNYGNDFHSIAVTIEAANHRSSIFRLLVGEAIKAAKQNAEPRSWGLGSDPGKAAAKLAVSPMEIIDGERELEVLVSRYICACPSSG